MNVFKVTVATLALAVLFGCSSTTPPTEVVESKSFDYSAPPVKTRALDVPPDLTSYGGGDDRYAIPGEGESVTRYSEFSKGGNRKALSVLPQSKKVRLERQGTQRWLVVDDTAENVWPIIKAFWQENGLVLKVDNPLVGVMETEWAENHAKTPVEGLQKYLGKVFDGMASSSERDQYHTRIERSKDGGSTLIYIVHYGMQEVALKDETGFKWVDRPSDPELEATMLQLLMSKLGGGPGVLDTSKKPVAAVADSIAAPKLNKLPDGSQSISLSEPFDKSWRKVGLALEQSKLALADKDRSKGIYFLSAGKDDAKSRPGAEKVTGLQVKVLEQGGTCEVTVKSAAAESNADTQKIIDTLYKALGRI